MDSSKDYDGREYDYEQGYQHSLEELYHILYKKHLYNKMEITIPPNPYVFSFNEQDIISFDTRMKKIGFIYEGTLDECFLIYRKSENQFVSIQVGFGGVLFVKLYTDNECKSIDLGSIKDYIDLFKKIKRIVEYS